MKNVMLYYDYLSWIVFLSHAGGVRVSECGKEQILHLIRTEGLKATVYMCTSCTLVSLSTTSVKLNKNIFVKKTEKTEI